ncbi:hypothetical protein [Endozoicomonas sp. 8E]|uniref:hypothetical protein n=1 Tax=Endozoicomonas sp. 8E TaxID=3035692 RepID=UPI0029393EB4|nr:hypothetical protein [Endozoicomonas sp. 8E]WOG27126.1 hypothetical protein P6910_21625 [Endozoicomonas sp. 8E]
MLPARSDIVHTNLYEESNSPPDNKRHIPNGYGIKTTLIESVSWQWLYTTHLLIAYELVLTRKNAPLSYNSYSWLSLEVAAGWLLKSYWNPDSLLFNPVKQQTASIVKGDHSFENFTMMFGSGQNAQQYQPSALISQQVPQTTHSLCAFSSLLSDESCSGNGGPHQHSHTLGLNCFVYPCNDICRSRPPFDNREPAEWPLNSIGDSTGQTGVYPEQSSCPYLTSYEHRLCFIDHHDLPNATDSRENSLFESLSDHPDIQHFWNSDQVFQPYPCYINDPSDLQHHPEEAGISYTHIRFSPSTETSEIQQITESS